MASLIEMSKQFVEEEHEESETPAPFLESPFEQSKSSIPPPPPPPPPPPSSVPSSSLLVLEPAHENEPKSPSVSRAYLDEVKNFKFKPQEERKEIIRLEPDNLSVTKKSDLMSILRVQLDLMRDKVALDESEMSASVNDWDD